MNETPRILIIEDDADLVAALKKILESRGYQIAAAYDTEEGYKKLSEETPDLIILDVMFGSKGESKGFGFAQQLRLSRDYSSVPVLMLTAINSEKPGFKFSAETDGEYLPVDSFLDKPVRSDELIKKVDELIAQKTSKWRNWPDRES